MDTRLRILANIAYEFTHVPFAAGVIVLLAHFFRENTGVIIPGEVFVGALVLIGVSSLLILIMVFFRWKQRWPEPASWWTLLSGTFGLGGFAVGGIPTLVMWDMMAPESFLASYGVYWGLMLAFFLSAAIFIRAIWK